MEFDVQWIKQFVSLKGKLLLTKEYLVFISHEITSQVTTSKSLHSLFHYVPKTHSPFIKKWKLSSIKEICKKRFIVRRTALEIFLIQNQILLFNFESSEKRDQLSKKLIRLRKAKCINLEYYNSLDCRKILEKKKIRDLWMNWKISNLSYLMILNSLAGRSFNDLSQYPVFPWVLRDFTSPSLNLKDSNTFRNLSDTMGSLVSLMC